MSALFDCFGALHQRRQFRTALRNIIALSLIFGNCQRSLVTAESLEITSEAISVENLIKSPYDTPFAFILINRHNIFVMLIIVIIFAANCQDRLRIYTSKKPIEYINLVRTQIAQRATTELLVPTPVHQLIN